MLKTEAFEPNPGDLEDLARFMTRTSKFYSDVTASSDFAMMPMSEALNGSSDLSKSLSEMLSFLDKDIERSSIPAGYSYLGQFIIHDISLDRKTDRFNQSHYPWNSPPQPILNGHKPFLDLETIYGREGKPASHRLANKFSRLKLGETLNNTRVLRSFPNDLPRMKNSPESDIFDRRNDENLLLAQTQVAFTKFHNAIVYKLGNSDTEAVFRKARRMTIHHYQYIILTDFLPRIINGGKLTVERIISEVQAKKNKFYRPTKDDMFVPLEFTVGAYRTAHSMIRQIYHLNRLENEANLFQLMLFTGRGFMGSSSNTKLPSDWIVNWKWFYDIDDSKFTEENFNFALKIDTNLSATLGRLVPGRKEGRANSLSALDLYRGVAWKLPTGQNLVRAMASVDPEITELPPEIIESLLDKPSNQANLNSEQRKFFTKNTPLLFYLLAEAEFQGKGETLGDAGSRIVAETIIKLIYETHNSILKKDLEKFKSGEDFLLNDSGVVEMLGVKDKETFGMPEMLKFIAGTRKNSVKPEEYFDELNPLG